MTHVHTHLQLVFIILKDKTQRLKSNKNCTYLIFLSYYFIVMIQSPFQNHIHIKRVNKDYNLTYFDQMCHIYLTLAIPSACKLYVIRYQILYFCV